MIGRQLSQQRFIKRLTGWVRSIFAPTLTEYCPICGARMYQPEQWTGAIMCEGCDHVV